MNNAYIENNGQYKTDSTPTGIIIGNVKYANHALQTKPGRELGQREPARTGLPDHAASRWTTAFIAPNLNQCLGKRVKNSGRRPDQSNYRNNGNWPARPNDFINIPTKQLAKSWCNKLQPLYDELSVNYWAKCEAGNGNAQKGNGKREKRAK